MAAKRGWQPPIDRQNVKGIGHRYGPGHKGTDVQAVRGTPIKAPADGIVATVERRPVEGLTTVIRDKGTGQREEMGHQQTAAVKRGQQVKQGQTVGKVGSSGAGSSGPHLHFEQQNQQGQPLNPEQQLGAMACLPMSPDTVGACQPQSQACGPQVGMGAGEQDDPTPNWNGEHWVSPVAHAQIHGIGNPFRAPWGRGDVHNGVDIGAKKGTPVRAPVNGVVVETPYRQRDFGQRVIIQDRHGFTHVLSHMARNRVPKVGSQVKAGQTVGFVDQTGEFARGPHVDYRIRTLQENHVNPMAVLGRWSSGRLQAPQPSPPSAGKVGVGDGCCCVCYADLSAGSCGCGAGPAECGQGGCCCVESVIGCPTCEDVIQPQGCGACTPCACSNGAAAAANGAASIVGWDSFGNPIMGSGPSLVGSGYGESDAVGTGKGCCCCCCSGGGGNPYGSGGLGNCYSGAGCNTNWCTVGQCGGGTYAGGGYCYYQCTGTNAGTSWCCIGKCGGGNYFGGGVCSPGSCSATPSSGCTCYWCYGGTSPSGSTCVAYPTGTASSSSSSGGTTPGGGSAPAGSGGRTTGGGAKPGSGSPYNACYVNVQEQQLQYDYAKLAADDAYRNGIATGQINGMCTLEAKKFAEQKAQDAFNNTLRAGQLTGCYNGQKTVQEQQLQNTTALDALKLLQSAQTDPFAYERMARGVQASGIPNSIAALTSFGPIPKILGATQTATPVTLQSLLNASTGAPGSTVGASPTPYQAPQDLGSLLTQKGWRSAGQVSQMTPDDVRNTAIVGFNQQLGVPVATLQGLDNAQLTALASPQNYQAPQNFSDLLAQEGWRQGNPASYMSPDDMRNTAIVELNKRLGTAIPSLQGMNDQQLISLAMAQTPPPGAVAAQQYQQQQRAAGPTGPAEQNGICACGTVAALDQSGGPATWNAPNFFSLNPEEQQFDLSAAQAAGFGTPASIVAQLKNGLPQAAGPTSGRVVPVGSSFG